MQVAFEFGVILLLIFLNGLFSLGELALVSANRNRLAMLERKGTPGAAQARLLTEDPQLFLPTVQVGITGVSVVSGVFGGARLAAELEPIFDRVPLIAPISGSLALALVVIVITYLTLVLGELVPKQLALRHPEALASFAARPLGAMARATRPLVWLLGASTSTVLRLFGAHETTPQTVTEEELKSLLVEGEQTGVIESEERDMIERVLRLADKPVRAIMTPRTEIAWLDRTDPARDIAQTLKAQPQSRWVVCDGAVDNVVGIVRAKDLLNNLLDGKELNLAGALRQPIIMPDTVTALDALERLKADPHGLALVMDEYGSFEGVVTAADVLEAIVGDVEVTSTEPGEGVAQADGSFLFDGMTPVDEVKARLQLPDLPAEGSYHTLAGLMLALLQRVPRHGDRIVFGGWLFEILEMDGRRVNRVRASREALAEG